ncbi:MAG TPA: DUF2298 domain-containing protein, partial [Roseiflexaceae bacterium]|nr:DUF2298 domain-containing protein [Roseiflexaceae bacterium]
PTTNDQYPTAANRQPTEVRPPTAGSRSSSVVHRALFAIRLPSSVNPHSSFVVRRSSFVGWPWLAHFGLTVISLGVAMVAAAAPFLSSYRAQFGAAGPRPWEGLPLLEALGRVLGPAPAHTRLHAFLAMFGLFLLPLLALALRTDGRRPEPAQGGVQGQALSAGEGACGRRADGCRALLVSGRSPFAVRRSSFVVRRSSLGGAAGILLALAFGQAIGFPLLALLPLALALAYLAWRAAPRPALALALWAGAVGALLVLAADTVYVRDPLEGFMPRYNTVFKLYFQVWMIWGTVAGYAVWATLQGKRQKAKGGFLPFTFYLLPFTLLLAGSLVYPIETLRRGEPWVEGERELDGLAFLARRAPDDAAALAWLRANARAEDVVLMAWCACDEHEIGLAAAAAGVSTVLGQSGGHERMWRAGWPAWLAEIAARERDIPRIYETADPAEARRLLERYAVDYVYVGALERAVHGGAGLPKFDALFERVFERGGVRIYRVPPTRAASHTAGGRF